MIIKTITMTPQINAITFSGLVIVTVSIVVVGAIFSVQIRELILKMKKRYFIRVFKKKKI
jgi:hypothetical protein